MLKNLALFSLVTLVSAQVMADEFYVDRYKFEWTVLEVGKLEMDVVKSNDASYIQLSKTSGLSSFLRLSGEEAELVAEALKSTRAIADQQKGSETDVNETIKAGAFDVVFRTSSKYGFSVIIRNKESLLSNSMHLEKSEALALQPELGKAKKMISFVESKIGF